MVKEIFKCEICNKGYEMYLDAEECEKSHKKVKFYCKNPACFTHYIANKKLKDEKELPPSHKEGNSKEEK